MGPGQRKHAYGNSNTFASHRHIPVDYRAILSSLVRFQGRVRKFQDVLNDISEEDIEEIMAGCLYETDYLDFFNTGEKLFTLARENLPPEQSIYIPRLISNRVKLSSNIFKENCSDIFVFKNGMERVTLTELAYPNTTSTSGNQKSELTTRFIMLEDDQDWQEIRNLATVPIHLIRYEEDPPTFILEETFWASEVVLPPSLSLQNQKPLKEKVYISEEELITKIQNDNDSSGVCICDKPGTGKSFLLASLARITCQKYPERIVAYIILPHFIKNLQVPMYKTDLNPENALKLLLEDISPSPLAKAILIKAIHKGCIYLDLFLDGFDEIPLENIKWAKEVLRIIAVNTKNVKMFITSRPNHRSELEAILGLVAYDIVPFNETNQLNFLVTFWKQRIPSNRDESRLNIFGSLCLKDLSLQNQAPIFGTPLLCHLLAEINLKRARMYSHPEQNILSDLGLPRIFTSIYDLYKKFMEKAYNHDGAFDKEHRKSDCDLASKDNNEQIRNFHRWQSLKLLFYEIASAYSQVCQVDEELPKSKHLLHQILEMQRSGDSETLGFVHRTFAEFLIAEFFEHLLVNEADDIRTDLLEMTEKSVLFLPLATRAIGSFKYGWLKNHHQRFETLALPSYVWLYEFKYPVVAYFLNENLKTMQNDLIVPQYVVETFAASLKSDKLYQILYCCIFHNYIHLFRFMISILKEMSKEILNIHRDYFQHKSIRVELDENEKKDIYLERSSLLLCLAAEYSTLEMTQLIFQLFRECFHYDLQDLFHKMPDKMLTSFHLAIEKTNYELVEFYIDKVSLKERQLLYYCIQNSYGDTSEMTKKRIEICKLLLSKNKYLVHETVMMSIGNFGKICACPILLVKYVHLDLIKFLIQNGADIYASRGSDDDHATIVTEAADYMSSADLQELIRFLTKDRRADSLFIPNYSKYQYPLHTILRNGSSIGVDTLRMILDIPGIPVNEKDGNGKSLIYYAVRGLHKPLGILEELVKRGAQYKKKDKLNEIVLHFGKQNGSMEMIRYLRSFGLSMNIKDKDGNTPIILAHKSLETITYLINENANVYAVNKEGDSVAHLAAKTMSQEDFHEFVTFILKKCKAENLFNLKNKKGKTPLHERLSSNFVIKDDSDTIKMILNLPGIKVNAIDKMGNNLILAAVEGNRCVETLKTLVSHGVNYMKCNKKGESSIDLAVERRNEDAVQYFILIGMKVKVIQRESKKGNGSINSQDEINDLLKLNVQ